MKTITLMLSAGRSGTNKLATLMSTVPDVYAEHEGDPGFHTVRVANLRDPSIGQAFVKDKIELFNSKPETHCVHTGHMVGEGFIEHFLDQGIVPNIIVLRRPMREVALSMFNLKWIPGRHELIRGWYSGPDEPGVLPYKGWETAHNYQLCYWWCLDTERRIRHYTPILKQAGCKIYETTLDQILDLTQFNKLLSFFGMENVESITKEKVNEFEQIGRPEFVQDIPDSFLEELEAEVLENIPAEFRDYIVKRNTITIQDLTASEAFRATFDVTLNTIEALAYYKQMQEDGVLSAKVRPKKFEI
jgi:hypothetical protein